MIVMLLILVKRVSDDDGHDDVYGHDGFDDFEDAVAGDDYVGGDDVVMMLVLMMVVVLMRMAEMMMMVVAKTR